MRELIILKTGSTLPALLARKGDFTDWISAGLGAGPGWVPDAGPGTEPGTQPAVLRIVDVENGDALPAYDDVAGVVITGSHDMVTERLAWSERVAAWLPGLVERGIPTLGICYGHQLLAHALGGQVGDNPNGREFGTVTVHLEAEAGDDPLLAGLPARLAVQVCHTQSALTLPPGARRLAHGSREPNQAFVVGESAWGVQFHPEFDAEVVRTYIEYYAARLRAEGQDPDALIAGCRDTPVGIAILRRFREIVASSRNA
jgi:GMP synthase (glutamine-hydrolysing)